MHTTGEGNTERGEGAPLPEDPDEHGDGRCWVCGAPVIDRHCKILCPRCGFMRDCSDP